jgi:hypothetical protein
MCLALVAHELVVLFVHSPGQLDTWLVARCMKGEWEWQKWKWKKQVANRASSGCADAALETLWGRSSRGHARGVPSAAPTFTLQNGRTETISSLPTTLILHFVHHFRHSLELPRSYGERDRGISFIDSRHRRGLEEPVISTNHLIIAISLADFATDGNTQGIRA